MKTRIVVTAVITAVLVSACSSSGGDTPPSASATAAPSAVAAVATPSASASPSPMAEMTLEEAGQQYLEIVQPVNDVMSGNAAAWDAAFNANDWQILSDLAATNLVAERTFTDALLGATWPESIAPYVDALVSSSTPEMVWYSGLANATDQDAFWNAFGTGGDFDRAAAQELRIRLGLANIGEE